MEGRPCLGEAAISKEAASPADGEGGRPDRRSSERMRRADLK